MNTELLIEKCKILEKIIIEIAVIYNSDEITEKQKALLETMIGAAIWYLPSGEELYSGSISKLAIEKVKEGTPIVKLTKEHRYPRKQAGKSLLSEKFKLIKAAEVTLYDLYMQEYGKYNLVVKKENRDLVEFQKDGAFIDDLTAYNNAAIELDVKTIQEIKELLPPKLKKKNKALNE